MEWLSASEMGIAFPETMPLESAEAVDDLTLRYTTTDPILNSPDCNWQWMYVVPPHIWVELGDEGMFAYENFPPVGTGPYVVTEHEPGSHFVMDAREDCYLGKPPIDRVVFQIYANTEALISAIQAGEIDATTAFLPPELERTSSGPLVVLPLTTCSIVGRCSWRMRRLAGCGTLPGALRWTTRRYP